MSFVGRERETGRKRSRRRTSIARSVSRLVGRSVGVSLVSRSCEDKFFCFFVRQATVGVELCKKRGGIAAAVTEKNVGGSLGSVTTTTTTKEERRPTDVHTFRCSWPLPQSLSLPLQLQQPPP